MVQESYVLIIVIAMRLNCDVISYRPAILSILGNVENQNVLQYIDKNIFIYLRNIPFYRSKCLYL